MARWPYASATWFILKKSVTHAVMVRMGIGMVLLAGAVVGTVLAGIAGIAFGATTAFATKGVQDRRKVILTASLFPFVCLVWTTIVFAFQAVINEELLHRDPGAGDAWECPLPNGYGLVMIDTTDHGWVYNPKTQVAGGVAEQEDAPYGVRLLQVDGRYIVGGLDSKADEEDDRNSQRVDSYFLLDTQTGKRTNFPDYQSLRAATEPLGIRLKLERITTVYSRYRFTWFDVFAVYLFCFPPLIAAIFLVRWIVRLRRLRGPSSQPA
jgi:hypothetical protein